MTSSKRSQLSIYHGICTFHLFLLDSLDKGVDEELTHYLHLGLTPCFSITLSLVLHTGSKLTALLDRYPPLLLNSCDVISWASVFSRTPLPPRMQRVGRRSEACLTSRFWRRRARTRSKFTKRYDISHSRFNSNLMFVLRLCGALSRDMALLWRYSRLKVQENDDLSSVTRWAVQRRFLGTRATDIFKQLYSQTKFHQCSLQSLSLLQPLLCSQIRGTIFQRRHYHLIVS